jgi:hypothetical protein
LAIAGSGAREESEKKVFRCPLADEIQCATDMSPYRDLLANEISAVERKESEARAGLEKAKREMQACGDRVRGLQSRVEDQARSNETIHRQIQSLQMKIAAEAISRAEVQGRLKAYHEEMEGLNKEALAERAGLERSSEAESVDVLESKKQGLVAAEKEAAANLEALLRDLGRAEAVAEVRREKTRAESDLNDAQILAGLLGPDGIQGEMAARISDALEREVNEALQLIDAKLDFTLDLSGSRFLMGWNRDGKVIPFETINSAHFVLFIVPFLAALLKRMGRIREKEGLPTLKALCIEAESMTPKNLAALLKGLSAMKAKGYLDNVLVAHYASIRDPEKLSGFKEHILKGEESI